MQKRLPKDVPARVVATRARSLVAYKLDAQMWEWHEQTGTDHGTDMMIELVEGEVYTNRKIEIQIKGRTTLTHLSTGDISIEIDVKTVNYALSSANAFVVFLVDVTKEDVYYLSIQEYFIHNPEKLKAASNNKASINLRIPAGNIINGNVEELCSIAKNTYIFDGEMITRV